jgi:hypothetical protein
VGGNRGFAAGRWTRQPAATTRRLAYIEPQISSLVFVRRITSSVNAVVP